MTSWALVRAVLAAAVLLVLAGCGGGDGTAGRDTQPPPVTVVGSSRAVVVASDQPGILSADDVDRLLPMPQKAGTPVQTIGLAVRREVLFRAGVAGRTAADCFNLPTTGTIICSIAYDSVTMTWTLTGDSRYSSEGGLIAERVTTGQVPVTAPKVYSNFWRALHDRSDQLRCDRITTVKVVPIRMDTGYRCQYLGALQDNRRTWVDFAVVMDRDGELRFQQLPVR